MNSIPDQPQDELIAEFTELIDAIAAQPDGGEKLNFIARIIEDPGLLDRAYQVVCQMEGRDTQ